MTARGPMHEAAALRYLMRRAANMRVWEPSAICKQIGNRLFYPERIEGTVQQESPVEAIAACALCPVMAECRAYALVTREPKGVWGGMTDRARERALASPDATRQALLDALNGVRPTLRPYRKAKVAKSGADAEHPPDSGELNAA